MSGGKFTIWLDGRRVDIDMTDPRTRQSVHDLGRPSRLWGRLKRLARIHRGKSELTAKAAGIASDCITLAVIASALAGGLGGAMLTAAAETGDRPIIIAADYPSVALLPLPQLKP
jgi:hypothetical protein